MLSESARMSSAAEARFRIATAESTGRIVRVVWLDSVDDTELAALIDAIPTIDLVVMVAVAGADASRAAAIGAACSRARVMTTTLVIRDASTSDHALSQTLGQVRPWSLMVVVAGDPAYLNDILTSFR